MKFRIFFCAAVLFFCKVSIFSQSRPIITGISALASKNRITVSWILPGDLSSVTKIYVYKSTKPFASTYDLLDKQPIAELDKKSDSWTDMPDTFSDYYYAVLTEINGRKLEIILPSINATVNGIHLKFPENRTISKKTASSTEKLYSLDAIRETPLPYLDIIEGINKKPVKMIPQAKAAAKKLSGTTPLKKQVPLEVYIFEEDLISPDGGDDFLLFEILRTTFIQKDYEQAAIQLKKLLGTNRSKAVSQRATFYLGEAYYYLGDYREAVKTFLSVYTVYEGTAKKWIDSSLDFMSIP